MPKVDFILSVLKKRVSKLSRSEKTAFEALLFSHIIKQAAQFLGTDEATSKTIIGNEESTMLNINIIQEMIRDIINTGDYSLPGIALYTNIPEDVLYDTLAGIMNDLSFEAARRIVDLHISVRRPVYEGVVMKIAQEYLVRETCTS